MLKEKAIGKCLCQLRLNFLMNTELYTSKSKILIKRVKFRSPSPFKKHKNKSCERYKSYMYIRSNNNNSKVSAKLKIKSARTSITSLFKKKKKLL